MLIARSARRRAIRITAAHRASQRGTVLLIAIIVMVALTLASLALTRSVYTANVIAGNLAFQRSATHSAEAGIEAAVSWLQNPPATLTATCAADALPLYCDQKEGIGYIAHRLMDPAGAPDWEEAWEDVEDFARLLVVSDGAGNRVQYVIERMCNATGDPRAVNSGCTMSPVPGMGTCQGGSSCAAGETNLDSPPPVYYRITVRVEGPRNTRSLVQAMVAL